MPAGDILGGLAQIGGLGALGAYQGDIEGKVLRQDMQNREIQNQLGLLRTLNEQQRLTRPQAYPMGANRVFMYNPATGQYQVQELPPPPLTDLDRARIGEYQSLADLHRAQTGQVGQPKPQSERLIPVGPNQGLFDPVERRMIVEPSAKPTAEKTLAPFHITDAQGNVRVVTPHVGEGGQINYSTSLLGQYGKPATTGTASAPRETTTTTTKLVPAKEITNIDEINKIQADLTAVTNEIAANPKISGWNEPGAYVRVEGHDKPVRREQVIAWWMLNRHNAGVSVRWDGKQWRLVRAWIPEKKEQLESKRVTGPPSQSQQAPSESDDEE